MYSVTSSSNDGISACDFKFFKRSLRFFYIFILSSYAADEWHLFLPSYDTVNVLAPVDEYVCTVFNPLMDCVPPDPINFGGAESTVIHVLAALFLT